MHRIKNNKTTPLNLVLSLSCCLLLAGCGTWSIFAKEDPVIKELTQRQKTEGWYIEQCYVKRVSHDVTVATDGEISHYTLRFVATLPEPAYGIPKVSLMGIGGAYLNLQGRGAAWSFEIPHNAAATAEMIRDRVSLVIVYTPHPTPHIPTPQPIEVVFPMDGFPQILLERHSRC